MSTRPQQLRISTAPFLREGTTTTRMMVDVLLATLPVIVAAVYFFGLSALLVIISASLGAVLAEWVFQGETRGSVLGTLADGSALLTGVLLALTLPPSIPAWMAFVGGAVAIGLGKAIWGGLGRNVFNPALVGRAFLQAAFPTAMVTWTPPGGGIGLAPTTMAWPLMTPGVDVETMASPLGVAKFQQQFANLDVLLTGNTAGSLGETSAGLLLIIGLVLALRRTFDWRLFVSTLVSVAAFAAIFWLVSPDKYPSPFFMLFSGGLMFGAVFMVTDPVTTPLPPRGAWIFGLGVGFLVVLLRLFGGLPEAVMYAILLMNAVTPLLNKATQPRRFGG